MLIHETYVKYILGPAAAVAAAFICMVLGCKSREITSQLTTVRSVSQRATCDQGGVFGKDAVDSVVRPQEVFGRRALPLTRLLAVPALN